MCKVYFVGLIHSYEPFENIVVLESATIIENVRRV